MVKRAKRTTWLRGWIAALALLAVGCGGGSTDEGTAGGEDSAREATTTIADAPSTTLDASSTDVDTDTDTGATTQPPATTTLTPAIDSDGDGQSDPDDADDDNDGVLDVDDDFPLNPIRSGPIRPLLDIVDGRPNLPPGPLADQLEWMLSEWAAGETTDAAEVEERFSPDFLSTTPVSGVVDFMNAVRTAWAGAEFEQVLHHDRYRLFALWRSPSGVVGQVVLRVPTDGTNQIASIGVQNWNRSNFVNATYASLDPDAALAELVAVNPDVSVLVARIENDECVSLLEHDPDDQQSIASTHKGYILGAAADLVLAGDLQLDQLIALDERLKNDSGVTVAEPGGTEFTLLEMATLMMSVSDNWATDHMVELVGDDAADGAAERFGHSAPSGLDPLLRSNELFNLRTHIGAAGVAAFLEMSDDEQRRYVNEVLDPLPPWFTPPAVETIDSVLVDAAWQASTSDVCRLMAELRRYPDTSDAMRLVDAAYGANAPLAFAADWDRSWFKGGSLAVNNEGNFVLTLSYLLESDDRGTYYVGVFGEDEPGQVLDQAALLGLTNRLLFLVDQGVLS